MQCDYCGAEPCECKNTEYLNDRVPAHQVGGAHYQSEYEHWDWAIDCKLKYLTGNATKYICRWRKKNGVEDLKKAWSYIKKIQETQGYRQIASFNSERTRKFIRVNQIPEIEGQILLCLCNDCEPRDIEKALKLLTTLIKDVS